MSVSEHPIFSESPYELLRETTLTTTRGESAKYPAGTVFTTGRSGGSDHVRLFAKLSPSLDPLPRPLMQVSVTRSEVHALFAHRPTHAQLLHFDTWGERSKLRP